MVGDDMPTNRLAQRNGCRRIGMRIQRRQHAGKRPPHAAGAIRDHLAHLAAAVAPACPQYREQLKSSSRGRSRPRPFACWPAQPGSASRARPPDRAVQPPLPPAPNPATPGLRRPMARAVALRKPRPIPARRDTADLAPCSIQLGDQTVEQGLERDVTSARSPGRRASDRSWCLHAPATEPSGRCRL